MAAGPQKRWRRRLRARLGLCALLLLLLLLMMLLPSGAQPQCSTDTPPHNDEERPDQPEEDAPAPPPPPTSRSVKPAASVPRGWTLDVGAHVFASILEWARPAGQLLPILAWGWGASTQEQRQQMAGFVPEWAHQLWAQHWRDVLQHLPPPWNHLLVQCQAHGRSVGVVLVAAAAGAVAVTSVSRWSPGHEVEEGQQQQQHRDSEPDCSAPMAMGASSGDGAERAAKALDLDVHLYSAWLVRPLYVAARVLLRGDIIGTARALGGHAVEAVALLAAQGWHRLSAWAMNKVELIVMGLSLVLLAAMVAWYNWGSWQEALERRLLRVAPPGIGVGEEDWHEAARAAIFEELGGTGGLHLPSEEAFLEELEAEAEAAAVKEALVAFTKMQYFLHRRMAALAEARTAHRAQHALTAYDGTCLI